MEAFTPRSMEIVVAMLALLAATLVAAFAVGHLRRVALARALAWSLVIAAAVSAERITRLDAVGARMLAICAVTLIAMKGVVSVEHRAQGGAPLSARQWLLFAAWPGMRPALFLPPTSPANASEPSGAGALLVRGVVRLAIGAALLGLARAAWILTG